MSIITPSVAKQLKIESDKQRGLENSSLTTSYPPPAGYKEARDLLKRVRQTEMTKEIIVELGGQQGNTEESIKVKTRLTDKFMRTVECINCFDKSEKQECLACLRKEKYTKEDDLPEDDVDGRAEEVP